MQQLKTIIQETIFETFTEELCAKGKAYIKARKAAGEKSSAYLSGRAVKVCKGLMENNKEKVECKKCDWKWDLEDGGNYPYLCHKCGYDNSYPYDKSIDEGLEDISWTGNAVEVYKGSMKSENKIESINTLTESLRNWFEKEDWVRIDTQGNITGPCGTMKKGKATTRCLPRAKANRLTKAQRASTARKKVAGSKKGKQFVPNTKKAKVKLRKK
jgi:hypothetical protein